MGDNTNFNPPEAKVVFFDLDETITNEDTDGLWVKWRSKDSLWGKLEILHLVPLYRAYKKGKMVIERYMRYHRFRAMLFSPSEYTLMANKFFNESGKYHIFKEAEEIIETYKKNGTKIVMLTAQNYYIAKQYADYLEMDHLLANNLIVKKNRFKGSVKPYCFKEGKIIYAEEYLKNAGFSFKDCAFYSDSINDAPLLSMVAHPVVVNPDSLLLEKAGAEGWVVVRFGS